MEPGCTLRPRRRHSGRTPADSCRRSLAAALTAALALGACATTPSPSVLPLVVVDRALLSSDANVSVTRPSSDAPGAIRGATRTGFVDGHSLDTVFRRARDLVETESGTDLSTIRLELVDDVAILAEVSAETRRLVHGQLGDGPLAERMLETLTRGQIGTYAALYSGRHRSVMVSRNVLASYLDSLPGTIEARDEALLVLMLHELVHAADDLRHDIHAKRALDFRASFAQSAVFEGHAQWLTRVICRREGCLGGLAALDAFMFDDGDGALTGDGESVANPPSRLDRNLLEYSYVEGERFVATLAARADGAATLERLLAEPPYDPLQILAPDSFPDTVRETRNRALLAIATDVDHAWTRGDGARVAVATSPLKGVDLRADPARRAAAIDGFTRLVTAMVAVQFHDPGQRARPPIEVTLMRTDRPDTARLFADTLHAHARLPGAKVLDPATGSDPDGGANARSHTLKRTELITSSGDTWRTVIATDGRFVVQASGRAGPSAPIDTYVLGVLDALVSGGPT
mgnify:CR=1 FL=1